MLQYFPVAFIFNAHVSSPKVSTVIFKRTYLLTAKQMIFTHITKLLSYKLWHYLTTASLGDILY